MQSMKTQSSRLVTTLYFPTSRFKCALAMLPCALMLMAPSPLTAQQVATGGVSPMPLKTMAMDTAGMESAGAPINARIDPRSATPSSAGGKVSGGTTWVDYGLYSGVLAARLTDYLSTEEVLAHHGHENLLPGALVRNKPAFAAFSLGAGAAEILLSRTIRKSHPKMARAMLAVDFGATGAAAGHNFSVVNWRQR